MKELDKLKEYEHTIAHKQHILNILGWELRVSTPEMAKDALIDRITELDLEVHKLATASTYHKLIVDATKSEEFALLEDAEQRYVLRLLKTYEKNKRVPEDFLSEYSRVRNVTNQAWEKAKEADDYETFKPHLAKMIELTKKYYQYKNPDMNLYDAMLDEYEEGMTSKEIDVLFAELKKALIPLIKKVSVKNVSKYTNKLSASELMAAAEYLLTYIGFDMKRGALGIYPHGFTEKIANNDVRIAFKCGKYPLDFASTIIHEGGHGIFEQSPKDNLSAYETVTIDFFGLHESQSRFYENILGRNKNFWVPIYDEIKTKLKLDLTLDEFVSELNTVSCTPIRTEADELTYSLHIIIRYEIERALFNEEISVDDLPDVWNKKMQEYLGIEITNPSEGLMQDVHWSEGNFGYFPSYLLGNIFDGMFLEKIEKELGSIDDILASGKILEITKFLQDNIYKYGAAYNGREVVKRVCGKEVSVKPIIKYFKNKYDK